MLPAPSPTGEQSPEDRGVEEGVTFRVVAQKPDRHYRTPPPKVNPT